MVVPFCGLAAGSRWTTHCRRGARTLIFGGVRAGVVSVKSGVPVTHIWALTRGITSFARLCQNFYHKLKRRGALPTCNFDTVFSRGAHPNLMISTLHIRVLRVRPEYPNPEREPHEIQTSARPRRP